MMMRTYIYMFKLELTRTQNYRIRKCDKNVDDMYY